MWSRLAHFASIVVLVGLLSPLAVAQQTYDFDGLPDDPNYASDPNNQPYDPTDWMTVVNWSDSGFDPDPNGAFGPPIPDFTIRVELEEDKYGSNAPVIGPGDAAQALEIRIGRAGGGNLLGEGLLTMTGGTLTLKDICNAGTFNCNSRLRVGAAQVSDPNERFPGTFDMEGGTVTTDTLWIGSGSHGEMNMSDGVVNTRGLFYFDWTGDEEEPLNPLHNQSVLNMSGGTINVGTSSFAGFNHHHLRMYRESELNLSGGEILITGAAELGTQKQRPQVPPLDPIAEIPNVTVSITDGLLEASDFLQVRGSVDLSGGILRAESFNETDSIGGTVNITAGGLLQFNNAQESVMDVEALITSGFFFTTDINGLDVTIVDVGGTDFTQVSIAAACGTGDFDCNGIVDGNDFLLWQTGGSPSPLSASDLADWENNYATPLVAAVASVPEPSSVVLVMLVSVSMAFGCRNFRGKKTETNRSS